MKLVYRSILFFLAALCLINLWDVIENALGEIDRLVMTVCLILAVISALNTEIVHWAIGYNAATVVSLFSLLQCVDQYHEVAYGMKYSSSFSLGKIEGVNGLIFDSLPFVLLFIATIYCLMSDLSNLKKMMATINPPAHPPDYPFLVAPSYPISVDKKGEQGLNPDA
jgi:hypothetical protein